MKALGTPLVFAGTAALLAAFLHPVSPLVVRGATTVLAFAALLLVVSAVARTKGSPRDWPLAAGLGLIVASVAWDGLHAHRGFLTLAAGQATANFTEEGWRDQPLGLHPLGFSLAIDSVDPTNLEAILSGATARGTTRIAVSPSHAESMEGWRLASPSLVATGEATRLTIGVAGAVEGRVTIGPDRPGRLGDLEISLDQYFPEFALNAQRQPYTLSAEPRNPAALLRVTRGTEAHRIFVIQALPQVHRVPELAAAFSLEDVQAAFNLRLSVSREPAAGGLLAGAVLLALGVAWRGRGDR